MKCRNCKSKRIQSVSAKCGDCCSLTINGKWRSDYVPDDSGIGSGDYIKFDLCLDCGMIQDNFPLSPTALEEEELQ